MKVLVITRSAWDNSNSTGNTMSVFWNKYPKDSIANIYFRDALPYNDVCNLYYSISDFDVIKGLFNPFFKSGKKFNYSKIDRIEPVNKNTITKEEKTYNYFRNRTSVLALILQEFFWSLGFWKNKKFRDFLGEFKPDVIFFPCFSNLYTHKVLWYIKKQTKAKVVLFHADDYISGIFKSDNYLEKKYLKLRTKQVKKSALKANLNYCISQKQKLEYERIFNKKMKLLYKGADCSEQPKMSKKSSSDIIKIVFIGSMLYGRWKTLGMLAKIIKKFNQKRPVFELNIYSQYIPTEEMAREMIIEGASKFMGKIPASVVPTIMKEADIVLHVESFDEIEKLKTRLSFSTKIVDCLFSGRAFMAIGWKEAASIDYLVQNDAALVAFDEKSITEQLQKIVNNPIILEEYAQRAWECGKRNHQINEIQKNLYNDLQALVSKKK